MPRTLARLHLGKLSMLLSLLRIHQLQNHRDWQSYELLPACFFWELSLRELQHLDMYYTYAVRLDEVLCSQIRLFILFITIRGVVS